MSLDETRGRERNEGMKIVFRIPTIREYYLEEQLENLNPKAGMMNAMRMHSLIHTKMDEKDRRISENVKESVNNGTPESLPVLTSQSQTSKSQLTILVYVVVGLVFASLVV